MVSKLPSRHPVVLDRALPLTERDHELQIQRGNYITDRGERFAIPSDHIRRPDEYKHRQLWQRLPDGSVGRVGVRLRAPSTDLHRRVLSWARDHVDERIPQWWYLATLGHDLHVSTYASLYGKHWHAGWANPLDPYNLEAPLDPTFDTMYRTHFAKAHDCRLGLQCPANIWTSFEAFQRAASSVRGFTENLGLLSAGKVTDAFVSEEIDELVSTTGTEYADFDFHEVGTSTQAENNNDTALITTTGIARATGSPTDADPIYRNVGTITADATETWQEHGLFNNSSGAALMDRSLTGGQSVASPDQVQYTYELTKNPEA